jgi:hypothetical protein
MGEITVTGGARIGIVNATWPLAKLSASPVLLRLICLMDTYDFESRDVVSLERYGSIPFFRNGVRILHGRADYPSKIIFWCFGNPEELIIRIREAGFLPTAPASSEIRWRGIPFRWAAILFFIVVWNGSFLLNGAIPHGSRNQPGVFILAPLLFAFLASWGIKRSPTLQNMVLNDGRSINEVKGFLSLLPTVSAFLLVVFAALLFTGAIS